MTKTTTQDKVYKVYVPSSRNELLKTQHVKKLSLFASTD